MIRPVVLTLYAKPRCHLCEVAHAVVEGVRTEASRPTRLEVVDVTTDAALLLRYRLDVPVLAVDGVEAFRHRVDAAELARRVREAAP